VGEDAACAGVARGRAVPKILGEGYESVNPLGRRGKSLWPWRQEGGGGGRQGAGGRWGA